MKKIDWDEIAFYLAKMRLSHPEILDKELPPLIRRAQMRLVVTNAARPTGEAGEVPPLRSIK